jgi:hypothetical protein
MGSRGWIAGVSLALSLGSLDLNNSDEEQLVEGIYK